MKGQSKTVFITEDGSEAIRGLASALRAEHLTPESVPRNGNILLAQIRQFQPAVVIMHAFMPEADAIDVMETYRSESQKPILFFVMGSSNAPALERQLLEAGADYYVLLPADAARLALRISKLLCSSTQSSLEAGRNDVELAVTELMHQLGVPAHIKGYGYIRLGILLSIEDHEMVGAVTKLLYPEIAKQFKTTPSRVERAIRHAIEVAWERGDIEVLNNVFGYTINNGRGKPTNSEFIAMVADKIRLQYKRHIS